MVLFDGDHGSLSVKLRDCQFFSGTQFVPTGLHWYPLWLFTWSFGYSSTTSDGSPYEKRVDAKGHVLSDTCIADEAPLEELPKGWAWARLSTLFTKMGSGSTPAGGRKVYQDEGPLLIRSQNVHNEGLKLEDVAHFAYSLFKKRGSHVLPNDILLNITGASIGRCAIVPNPFEEADVNQHVLIMRPVDNTLNHYLHIAIVSPLIQAAIMAGQVGATKEGLSATKASNLIVPLPPMAEQHRIVERINQLMPLVEEYGELEDAREELDAALPSRLRKSVLQMAVQGKLVPQDPADEPASALLERMREQRRQLVAEKKMKAPKGGESIIFRGSDGRRYEKRMDVKGRESEPVCIEDEIPFEIPESWEWTRLENLADVSGGNTPKKEQLKPVGNIPYFKVADMNSIGNEREMVNAKLYVDDSYTGKTFPAGTIIYPKNGGAVLTNKRRMLVKESVVDLNTGSCTPYLEDCLNYLRLFFETIDFREFYKGTAVPTVNGSLVKELLVPLPSLTEQSRIVKRLEILQNIIV